MHAWRLISLRINIRMAMQYPSYIKNTLYALHAAMLFFCVELPSSFIHWYHSSWILPLSNDHSVEHHSSKIIPLPFCAFASSFPERLQLPHAYVDPFLQDDGWMDFGGEMLEMLGEGLKGVCCSMCYYHIHFMRKIWAFKEIKLNFIFNISM